MPFDMAQFAQLGLGFSETDSGKLAKLVSKGCFLLGLIGGAGLTLAGLSDMGKAGQGFGTPRSQSFYMILAGLGVGTVFLGGGCRLITLKLTSYTDGFTSTTRAVGALTPAKRSALQDEARKLLTLGDKIDELYETEKANPRLKLSA